MAGFVKDKSSTAGGTTVKVRSQALTLPVGTTSERPGVVRAGDLRYNSSNNKVEYHNGSGYVSISGEGTATITQDSFTGDGSTLAFTMSTSVTNNQEQRVIVAVENVYQNPANAYTVSGTTITFSSAPGNTESIVVIHGFDSNIPA